MDSLTPTILVVDDETDIRLAVADTLEDAGYVVLEAANVLEAVAVLGGDHPIDVVLTDIDMPGGLDGVDLANFVSNHMRHVGIAVTSGRTEMDEGCLPPGTRFLAKPCAPSAIVNLVEELVALSNSRQRRRA